jgi:hypothetical protein
MASVMMNRHSFLLWSFLCVSVSLCPISSARADTVDHSAFDAILKANVKDQRVDYNAIKKEHLPALNGYLDMMSKVDPAKLDRNEQLAYFINLYNATMIRAITDRLRPGYSPSEKDYGIFKEPLVRTNGKTISLNDLENNVIRPTFKDPRIHVALVCGARSCPPLLPRAYKAEDLDATLDQNMKNFVTDAFRNPIDEKSRTLKLSHIFDWYADDFGGKQAVPAFVGKWAGKDYAGWKVEFVDYSWDLNSAQ